MTEKEQMLISILKCRRIDLYTRTIELNAEQQSLYDQMLNRRKAGEPLQYIIGFCNFFGYKIFLDDRVLIPRPETELLVEEVLKDISSKETTRQQILDLGTGSGNIPIALAKENPHCEITAVDISQDALNLAQDNARFNGVDERIHFVCEDMNQYFQKAIKEQKKFDIIISNPPYIPTSQLKSLPSDVKREPTLALDGGADGMDFYRVIIQESSALLGSQGRIYLEMGDGQKQMIEELFAQKREYQSTSYIEDYINTPRIFKAIIK